ncbi:MAG: energy-coupling factor ABC transporter ATP-binding protein [Bacteroidales bacterium]|nr:energy-coupling factor ABC transporter ATP-binding protein [Bacteroidales bacterium]
MDNSIFIRNLVFKYTQLDGDFGLGPIALDIPKGNLILFHGLNGSGKTTLAKIITKHLTKNVIYDELIIPEKSFYYNQLIEENIFIELTVQEHLKLFSKQSVYKVNELFDLFPVFDELKDKYPDELSGGQKQLLSFCTIISKPFDMIVFDEIFNHLDKAISNLVLQIIKDELVNTRKMTVILIAHHYDFIKPFCELTVEFKNGLISNIE